ncbi:chemotaxis protein CheW [Halorhabdus salina]|uniref:chemotaxis protein CheW n=1 Tax=Halorhabdus salina TaxID=2750670 RepID=UPI0015EE3F34|nr:chemotaxis protein CheW [Halorhabdus salina]
MSDEDDERMDRARRIRNLREGRRGEDEPTDESPDADDGLGEPPESASSDGSNDPDADGDNATDTDNADEGAGSETADGKESTSDDTGTPGTDDESDTAQPMPEDTDTDETAAAGTDPDEESQTGSDSDDEALSAAQAAAQAASEFEGEDAVSMDVEGVGETAAGEASTDESAASAGATVADASVVEQHEEETRVLEFRLGDELYCLDITYVEEIVREEAITRVPNTPEYVSGVVDLRGQITTILDPKTAVDIGGGSDDRLILVFDADTFDDHGYIGWLVDEVNQVTPITESEVKESPIDEPYINGVIERDDEFVIWTSPEMALDVGTDE